MDKVALYAGGTPIYWCSLALTLGTIVAICFFLAFYLGKSGAIRVTKVDVQAGTFEIGSYDDFSASKNSIALSINGCATKGAGSLTLVDGAFPAISAEKSLAIRYKAKVSASEAVTNVNAATVIFTIAAVMEG